MTGFRHKGVMLRSGAVVAVILSAMSFGLLTGAGCPVVTTPLAVSVTVTPTGGNPPLTVLATAVASGGTGSYSYQWASAPGGLIGAPTADRTNVTFAVAGTYTVTCTVTDSSGATASASATVTVTAPPTPSVTATATPSTTTVGTTATLTAVGSGGTPPYTYQWIQTAGTGVTVNGATSATASASFTQVDTYSFQVTLTDHAGATATASVTVTVNPNPTVPIQVNAGADRSTAPAWPGASAPIQFTVAGVPVLTATATDPSLQPGQALAFLWQLVSTPDATAQPASTVSILQPTAAGNNVNIVDVLINAPGTGSSLTRLRQNGQTNTVTNVVVPGAYEFKVTVTNPNGQSASDNVVRNIVPAWLPRVAAGGSFAGLAAQGGIYNRPIQPTTTLTETFSSISRVSGNVDFTYVDVNDATKTGSLDSAAVTPSDTVATITTTFTNSTVGTYQINAALAAGEVSVAAGDTGDRALVGKNWAKSDGTTETAAAAAIGVPNSTTAVKFAGQANAAVGANELRGKNILTAAIKGAGNGSFLIVWGSSAAPNDVLIYKPVTNQAGNANTIALASANFTLLETVATGAAVTDLAIGPLRGNAATPELVVSQTVGGNPVVLIYQNNGATGTNDKVYSVQADQTTTATPSTMTFDYTGSVGATAILLANYSSSSYVDLIVADAASVNGGATADGAVTILKGGTSGAIPSAGFSISTGVALGNLPANTWKQFIGVAGGADRFGTALGFGSGNVYVGAPATPTGTVYKIPTSTTLNGGAAVAANTLGGWNGPGTGFGSAIAVTEAGQVCVVDTTGGGTLYVVDPTSSAPVGGGAIPGGTPSYAPGALDANLAVGTFEGDPIVVAQDNVGNQLWLIGTGGTLPNPLVPMTNVTGIALAGATNTLAFLDLNGDGQTDVVASEDTADSVTALWGRQ